MTEHYEHPPPRLPWNTNRWTGVPKLTHLIAEAEILAGGAPCALGHTWVSTGGRMCSVHGDGCSEAVFRCLRCGEWDYEYRGCGATDGGVPPP